MFLTIDTPSTSDHENETLDTSQIKVRCACYDNQFSVAIEWKATYLALERYWGIEGKNSELHTFNW